MGVEREIRSMTAEEKSVMKAACVQAAATLIVARDSSKGQMDVEECVTLAALIYVRVATTDWREPLTQSDTDSVALKVV
jgi:hypothetical protein